MLWAWHSARRPGLHAVLVLHAGHLVDDHVDPLSVVDVDLQPSPTEHRFEMPEVAGHGK
jgi:hypothetical protein